MLDLKGLAGALGEQAALPAVRHELRRPLTAIRGYLETLLEDESDPQTTRRFLETARSEALRLSRLIDGMLDLPVLELQQPVRRALACDVVEQIRATIEIVSPMARKRDVTIRTRAPKRAVAVIDGDECVHALANLVENAIKHGSEHGTVEVRAGGSCRSSRSRSKTTAMASIPPTEPQYSSWVRAARAPIAPAAASGWRSSRQLRSEPGRRTRRLLDARGRTVSLTVSGEVAATTNRRSPSRCLGRRRRVRSLRLWRRARRTTSRLRRRLRPHTAGARRTRPSAAATIGAAAATPAACAAVTAAALPAGGEFTRAAPVATLESAAMSPCAALSAAELGTALAAGTAGVVTIAETLPLAAGLTVAGAALTGRIA